MDKENSPKIGIIYGTGSANPLSIHAASVNFCNLVFLYSHDISEKDFKQIEALKNHIKSYDITNLEQDLIIKILEEEEVSGITTFSEYKLYETSVLVNQLGLIGNSPNTVSNLANKLNQRKALNENPVTAIRSVALKPDKLSDCLNYVGIPAILKPMAGAGSQWTRKINSLEELEQSIEEFPSSIEYILEEFLVGHAKFDNAVFGDYVSVESVHANGKSQQLSITGKLPLTKHFSESGMFLPQPFSEKIENEILKVESEAIKTLGITSGTTHTEIKITKNGPKIIEVNGRMGGYVSELIKRAYGFDLIKATLKAAINKEVTFTKKEIHQIYFQVYLFAPENSFGYFKKIDGIDNLKTLSDINFVQILKNEGSKIDYRLGTENMVGIVFGASSNLENLHQITKLINDKICIRFNSN
ncbi:ATP-grasp domain-containing protein [Enterococcus plantarum]|uniref:ATP-grasp domain-containing protein n=1 Tax=Enterococcus plantarum TaxID=1077675 RepID=UPI001A8E063C|nr:ATP-grasp domain-containing protein [Enterococcus plantarum]MBO0468538.1 ATP-grasp domain-containing protein [Enterococcus plantarum]